MLDLSPQQKAAVQYVKGPLLVVAGAGGGKTSLLARKITWLIREYGADPAQIVALAAGAHTVHALRRRAEEALGRKVPELSVLRFAELGMAVVQQGLDKLGLRPGFSLYDRRESVAVIARLMAQTSPPMPGMAAEIAARIARRKCGLPDLDAGADDSEPSAAMAQFCQRYEQYLQSANAVDLDDLVRNAVRLLKSDDAFANEWRERIRFLLVDEYESVNGCDHALVCLLAAHGTLLTAAGDDTRAIDDRRASVADHLGQLPTDLADVRIIKLEGNFRSTRRIVIAANRVAGGAGAGADVFERGEPNLGAALDVLRARNEQQEAESIAAALMRARARYGGDYRDHGVFIRRAEQALPIERALRAHRIPYHTYGGPSLFEHAEVRDLWAYLRLACNPADDSAFLRALNTPRRDLDHPTLERLARFAADRRRPLLECALDPLFTRVLAPEQARTLRDFADLLGRLHERVARADPSQVAHALLAELRFADWLCDTYNDAKIAAQRMENVTHIIEMLRRLSHRRPEAGLLDLATGFQLRLLLDDTDDEIGADGVALMPLTAVSGVDFAHVYVVGFEEGLLPATESDTDIGAVSERRLAYLAISRARETVTFTTAEQRRLAGGVSTPRISRFLADLPAHDLEWTNTDAAGALPENTLANSATYVNHGSRRSR